MGRVDPGGISLPDLRWEMPGRFDSIVLPLDQGFRNQNLIIIVVFCYVPICFPVYFNSLCWNSNSMGLIRELGRLQGDFGETPGR